MTGFTYLALLLTLAILTASLAAASGVWEVAQRRDKEAELLFVGSEFRRALASYAASAPPGSTQQYPNSLEDLLKDQRFPNVKRHLRKVFVDPMTNSLEWGLQRNAEGGIVGIFSRSEQEPLKKTNFRPADQAFEDKKKYTEWVFLPATRGAAVATRSVPVSNQPTTGSGSGLGPGAAAPAQAASPAQPATAAQPSPTPRPAAAEQPATTAQPLADTRAAPAAEPAAAAQTSGPGRIRGQMPGQVPAQEPTQTAEQTEGQTSGESPSQMPGQFQFQSPFDSQPQTPAQAPPQAPVQRAVPSSPGRPRSPAAASPPQVEPPAQQPPVELPPDQAPEEPMDQLAPGAEEQ
jgi:type II secretory pathway pseudopilin PulG